MGPVLRRIYKKKTRAVRGTHLLRGLSGTRCAYLLRSTPGAISRVDRMAACGCPRVGTASARLRPGSGGARASGGGGFANPTGMRDGWRVWGADVRTVHVCTAWRATAVCVGERARTFCGAPGPAHGPPRSPLPSRLAAAAAAPLHATLCSARHTQGAPFCRAPIASANAVRGTTSDDASGRARIERRNDWEAG